MADRIVDYARLVMHKKRRVSPFQLAAAKENLYYLGGVRILCYLFVSTALLTDTITESRRVSGLRLL